MIQRRYAECILRIVIILSPFLFFFVVPVFASSLNITLISPTNNLIFNETNNITFICNATDSERVDSLTLYNNIYGNFSSESTKIFGELENDTKTLLLCHFNNNYTCVDGETATNSGTSFQLGKIMNGVLINNSDTLYYSSTNNFYSNKGTIEFWYKPLDDLGGTVYLFELGDSTSSKRNEMEIFIDDYVINFAVYDNDEISMYVYQDISSWEIGKWYYIVAVWESESAYVDIYVNGSNINNDYQDDGFYYNMYLPDKIYLGSEDTGSYQANGTFDEFRISNSIRIDEEINQSYQRAIASYTNITTNWTITNIPDGTYKWNCLAYNNNSESNWADSNYTFHIDINTPPVVNEIILSPNSSAEIDPGITINVTTNVTDISNVSTVIFQWKEVGDWNDTIMDYNEVTGLYENASIPIDITGGIYYYRIWTNDTNGDSGYSETKNISALWDYTWEKNPSNFTISGVVDTYASTFLTINNTGDDTLSFTLSHNWIRDVYFNGSLDTFSFSLGKGKESVINVTMHFLIYMSELEANIIINASHPSENPSPEFLIITATINSYVGGPYFDLNIVDYPSTISQSGSTNLTARVKNIGNETATNVWLNWTLPIGWSNTSSNLNQYLENITPGSTKWSSVLVTLDPSTAKAEIVTLYVNASCNENVPSLDLKVVGVNCNNTDGICGAGCTYVSDSNCPTPSAGGGTTTGPTIPYVVAKEETFLLYTEENIELVRGLNNTFVLKVVNPSENEDFTNVSLNVSGYLSQYIRIEPTFVYRINKNQTKEFMIFLEAPKYFTKGEYALNFTIIGISKGKRITENRIVALYVHEVSREEAIEYLNQSQNILNEMKDAGLNVKKILELVVNVNKYFEERSYEEVKETYYEIKRTRDYAFQVKSLLEGVEKEITESEEKGLKTPSAKNLFSLSKVAFMRGDFITALKRIEDCQNILSLETKGKINYMKLALDYWWVIVLGTIISSITGYFIRLRVEIYRIADRLRDLQYEELSITDKMRDIREKTFKENLMSMTDYHKAMYEYQKRLTEIRKEVTRLRTKRTGMKNIQTEIKNLEEEKKSIEKLIEETQISYFQNGEINRSVYDNKMNALTESLAELEKNIEILKMKHEHKG